ncbi:hypothetical protein Ct9H90mP29_13810 [bacterium]|nr:MAG: hypothetical protein Ct9H90mP29_13810 [bacterium]
MGSLALFLLSMTIGGLVGGANIIDQLFGNVNPQTTIARSMGKYRLIILIIVSVSSFRILEALDKT